MAVSLSRQLRLTGAQRVDLDLPYRIIDALKAVYEVGYTCEDGENSFCIKPEPSFGRQRHEVWPVIECEYKNGADGAEVFVFARAPYGIYLALIAIAALSVMAFASGIVNAFAAGVWFGLIFCMLPVGIVAAVYVVMALICGNYVSRAMDIVCKYL